MTVPPVATGRLTGARMIVTGGAGGIGAGIVGQARAEGAEVVIIDRSAERGRQVAEQWGAGFVESDLADAGQAGFDIDRAVAQLGGVDALVNCAGVLRRGPLLEISPAEWDAVFAVNTRSMLISMQRVATAMIGTGGGGSIVNIASMAAKSGGGDEGAYAASKAAVLALTRAAAMEWGAHAIRVNSVCPGYIPTEMGAATRTQADIRAWSTRSPLGRLGTPQDVAGVVCFLAGPDAGYLTGQAINVTGGMIMH